MQLQIRLFDLTSLSNFSQATSGPEATALFFKIIDFKIEVERAVVSEANDCKDNFVEGFSLVSIKFSLTGVSTIKLTVQK